MKRLWLSIVAAVLLSVSPAWAIESGHDCADENDQDLEAAQQQIVKPPVKPLTS